MLAKQYLSKKQTVSDRRLPPIDLLIIFYIPYSLFNGVIASWFSVMNITFSNLPFGDPKIKDTIIGHIGNYLIM